MSASCCDTLDQISLYAANMCIQLNARNLIQIKEVKLNSLSLIHISIRLVHIKNRSQAVEFNFFSQATSKISSVDSTVHNLTHMCCCVVYISSTTIVHNHFF